MTPERGTSDQNMSSHNDGGDAAYTNLQSATERIAAEAEAMKQKSVSAFGSRGVQDVTANFMAASNQLQPGELVKDEFFTLFEAVGALEVRVIRGQAAVLTDRNLQIMDPKMDSGYVEANDPFEPEYQVETEEPSAAEVSSLLCLMQ